MATDKGSARQKAEQRRQESQPSTPVFSARGLSKRFGGVRALSDVDFDVRAGEVHAVVGENGAGKSTLIKCLAGAYVPEDGTIETMGRPVRFLGPADARRAGIRVVYQELSLFGSLTVTENILGAQGLTGPLVSPRRNRRRAVELLARVGLDIDPDMLVSQLTMGQQQLVEIARELSSGGRLIVLDEPTSSLSPQETDLLFRTVAQLKQTGIAFVLITHFLEDVMQHTDRVTVMRNGRRIETFPTAQTTKADLVQRMIGVSEHVLRSTYEGDAVQLAARPGTPVVFALDQVALPSRLSGFSLELHAGEILGVYGDLASGHEAVADLAFGLARPSQGKVLLAGEPVTLKTSSTALAKGVGVIPADRREALALEQPIAGNMTLASLGRMFGPVMRFGRERKFAEVMIKDLGIAGAAPERAAGALSGGNQQKVLFARWLAREPQVLVLVEPTRGMDVGAKSDAIRLIGRLAEQGCGVIVVSSEPETVLAVATRVLVARRGRIVKEFFDQSLAKNELMEAAH
jgi:ribose transport system ATP-binding protein